MDCPLTVRGQATVRELGKPLRTIEMDTFDQMPENLWDKHIEYLTGFYDNPDGRVWADVSNKLSSSQLRSVLNYIEKRELLKYQDKISQMSSLEKQNFEDAIFRAGAIHCLFKIILKIRLCRVMNFRQ